MDYTWRLADGLGSVRSVASSVDVNGMQHYAAYGTPFGGQGSLGTPFGFTGEQTDANGLVYLRARHYAPSLGIFPSLDPFEGDPGRPMSLNGYSWVEGDPVNAIDPSGKSAPLANTMNRGMCQSQNQNCDGGMTYVVQYGDNIFRLSLRFGVTVWEIAAANGITNIYLLFPGMTICIPGQAPTINPSVTIFFGGSWGEQPDEQGNPTTAHTPGPDPAKQTLVWIENTVVFPYIGSSYLSDGVTVDVTAKQNQANSVTGYNNYNIAAIGYSGGADSALIFADSFQQNNAGTGRITGLALLEGTMSGGMSRGLRLETEWRGMLDRLLRDGVNVYILNDGGNDVGEWHQVVSYTPPSDATGTYCYDSRPNQEHWQGGIAGQPGTGTNNSAAYRDFVMGWLNSPTPCN